MFAPTVQADDTWLFLPGVLADGTEVDAWPIIQREAYPDTAAVLAAAAWPAEPYTVHPIGQYRWPTPHWIMYCTYSAQGAASDPSRTFSKPSRS